MNPKQLSIFVEDLEETFLRLHVQLRDWEEKYNQFQQKPLFKNRKEFEDIYKKYIFYQGKFYAYFYVLDKLGSDVPKIINRLRGTKWTSNQVYDTKVHYSEIFGHFPTKVFLDKQNVKI